METYRENVKKMLERRGYETTIVQDGDNYFRLAGVLVVFIDEGKVSVGSMKSVINMRNSEDEKIVIVHANPLTSEAKNVMIATPSNSIETFTFDEMSFDLLDVVPLHSIVISKKPKDWKHFPLLLSNDIAVRYFGFKKGDIVRVEEDDGTLTYRRVV